VLDAEALLRSCQRPLVIGIGGGGDVVGALATAELARRYDDADPVLGGMAWERRPIDPAPGPRSREEIEGAEELAPGILLAGPGTRVRGSGVRFAESRMAEFLGAPTVLVTLDRGPAAVAEGLREALAVLGCDALVLIDVGGDVLATGQEPGLRSPLCDAMMLAAGARLAADGAGPTTLGGLFGIGCDAELTPTEVLGRLAHLAQSGGLCGARGLTDVVAARLEAAIQLVPTEASAQAVRSFRGAAGAATIRGGTRELELSVVAASTFYFDVAVALSECGPLARAVFDATTLEEANDALNKLGVRTELDLEREAASVAS
jgi:hypothetical protein